MSDFSVVVGVGPEVKSFVVGDVVLSPNPAEYEYTDEDTDIEYLVCSEDSICAKKAE